MKKSDIYHLADLLKDFGPFKVEDDHIVSATCKIEFGFERYGDSMPVVLISRPAAPATEMSLLVLRHIRAATDPLTTEVELSDESYIAWILLTYFADLLWGDFSILAEYQRQSERFFRLALFAHHLRQDDPIRKKYHAYDITWMDDLEAKGQNKAWT